MSLATDETWDVVTPTRDDSYARSLARMLFDHVAPRRTMLESECMGGGSPSDPEELDLLRALMAPLARVADGE